MLPLRAPACFFRALGLGLALAILLGGVRLREEGFSRLGYFVKGAAEGLTGLVLSEELLRYEEHSDAEPIPLDVLMVSVTRTDLQAILGRIT